MRTFTNVFYPSLTVMSLSEDLTVEHHEMFDQEKLEVKRGQTLAFLSEGTPNDILAWNSTGHALRFKVKKQSKAKNLPADLTIDLQPMSAAAISGEIVKIIVSDTGLVFNTKTGQPATYSPKHTIVDCQPITLTSTKQFYPWVGPVAGIQHYGLDSRIPEVCTMDLKVIQSLKELPKPISAADMVNAMMCPQKRLHDIRCIHSLITHDWVYAIIDGYLTKTTFDKVDLRLDASDLKVFLSHLPALVFNAIDFVKLQDKLDAFDFDEVRSVINVIVCASARWANDLSFADRLNDYDFNKNRDRGIIGFTMDMLIQPTGLHPDQPQFLSAMNPNTGYPTMMQQPSAGMPMYSGMCPGMYAGGGFSQPPMMPMPAVGQ